MEVVKLNGFTYVDSGLSCDTFNIIHITDQEALTSESFFLAINHFRIKDFTFCVWISMDNLSPKMVEMLSEAKLEQQNREPAMIFLKRIGYMTKSGLPGA